MTYQPVVPLGGLAGWSFLERTRERQQAAFDNSPTMQRDRDYFRENIASAKSAEDLVGDRRLLSVVLGAFGLQADISNKAFIREVLDGGTLDPDSLANKLSDKRYLDLSKALGYGDFSVANTQLSDFPDRILNDFGQIQFETAIGAQNENMSLALGLDRLLDGLLEKDLSDDARWLSVMGSKPLRKIFETALGLPQSFGALDLDIQIKGFREKSEKFMGAAEVSAFSDPELRDKLRSVFLVRGDATAGIGGTSASSVALAVLQNGAAITATF